MRDDFKDDDLDLNQDHNELLNTPDNNEEVDNLEVGSVESVEETTPEPVMDREEVLARKNGWLPQEEWKGRPGEWKTAKQFNDHARLIAQVKGQQRDLDNLKKYMELNQKQAKLDAMEAAKAELQAAKDIGDFEAYEEANKKYSKVEVELNSLQEMDYKAAEEEFINRNSDWFDPTNRAQVEEITAMANQVGYDYPGEDWRRRLDILERRVFDAHPEYKRVSRNADRAVVSSSGSAINKSVTTGNSGGANFNKLPSDLQKEYFSLHKTLEKQGIPYTKDEYIRGLKDLGEIR